MMFCAQCGKSLVEHAHFCTFCGGAQVVASTSPEAGWSPHIDLEPSGEIVGAKRSSGVERISGLLILIAGIAVLLHNAFSIRQELNQDYFQWGLGFWDAGGAYVHS